MSDWLLRHHLSTWLLIIVLIMLALVIRPQLLNFIVFIFAAAALFIVRDLGRIEGRPPKFGRSTMIASAVIIIIVLLVTFGVRLIAI